MDTEFVLQQASGAQKHAVGRGRGDDNEVRVAWPETGGLERAVRGMLRQIASCFLIRGDMALADAGALEDPRVGRVHHFLEIGIGKHTGGQVTTGAEYSGIDFHAHSRIPKNDDEVIAAQSKAALEASWRDAWPGAFQVLPVSNIGMKSL